MDFDLLNTQIRPLDKEAMDAAKAHWDYTAKPVGSLGELEDIVIKLAGIQKTDRPEISKRAAIVLCADNGVTAQGVAMTPPDVTALMARFIAQRRSAVCLMARQANAETIAVDMGMFQRITDEPRLLDRRVADGTSDFTKGPAMTREQALQAIEAGIALAKECKAQGHRILATGEMGIGNTTTSSAISAVLLGRSPELVTGRGVGLSDEGLRRKQQVIAKAIEVNAPDPADALDVLHKLGGFDIAAMCGVFLGGALCGLPVIVDGFISSASALTAQRLCPAVKDYMLASHASAEPAASMVSDALGLTPVIHAGMRLGEGTGAVALLPLIDMALTVYNELFTYGDLGM